MGNVFRLILGGVAVYCMPIMPMSFRRSIISGSSQLILILSASAIKFMCIISSQIYTQ